MWTDQNQNQNMTVPSRIIITESEETYYSIKVVTGDKEVNSTIELSGIDKLLNNKSWTREHFMYDVKKLDDRIYFAGVLQEMVKIIEQYQGEVVQIVYETDPDQIKKVRELGHLHIISEESKMTYYIKEIEPVAILNDEIPQYDNISNSVEHVEKFYEFHTQKVMAAQLKHCDDHLVNLDDVVLFIGFAESSQMVKVFKYYNYISKLEYHILNDEENFKNIPKLDCFNHEDYGTTKMILVVNEMVLDQFLPICENLNWNKISLVVCDTNMERESTLLLSHCKRHEVTHVKKIQYGAWYNFGVLNTYQQCEPHSDNAHNGVITFTDEVFVDRRIYVVFVDSRYANIYRIANALELCKDIWSISMIHDIFDDLVKNYYDYKFMPVYQTDQIVKLCNLMKRGLFHTPLAVFTRFPAIARVMFESSIFVSCDRDHFKKYIANINDVFDQKIKRQFELHVGVINAAKTIASDRKKKIDLVREAQVKSVNKKVLHDIVYNKQEKLLEQTLKQLKIS